MDYSAGVDISRYKNIPVPTSYMAIRSEYNFVGGYENDTQAGVLHVANHHISPGKKQWTWGNGDFGQAWDRNLTDADGPYIELMTGVYTDNQPDFSWLQPYEEKTFTQYFMPYRELGVVKNASSELLMNLEPEGTESRLKLFATSAQQGLHIIVRKAGNICFEQTCDLSPEQVFDRLVPVNDLSETEVIIYGTNGREKLSWRAEPETIKEVPEAARPALAPEEIRTNEELYLTGLHLEQYRHATYCPTDYYLEALRRDNEDARCNNAMGLWLIRKGQFAQAEPYLRKAISRLTEKNPNPYDGEAFYNLGLALKFQGKNDEAYNSFYKSCWNAAWQDAGYYSLAQISVSRGNWEEALGEIEKSLLRNWHNLRGRHLKAMILRHLERPEEALAWIEDSLKIDAFNFGCLFEKYLITREETVLSQLRHLIKRGAPDYEALVLDYTSAGRFEEALAVAELAIGQPIGEQTLLHYYKSWCLIRLGETDKARTAIRLAEKEPADYCFPNALEAIEALQCVADFMGEAPKALYYLGNLWYDKRQYTPAIAAWERSSREDETFPTVWRNLALAYFNKLNRPEEAVLLLEKAFRLDPTDARVLMELDQLYKRLNRPHTERMAFLEQYMDIVITRDDLYLEYVTLLNQTGQYREAIRRIDQRKFHPWEGGEGKVPAQYQIARLELAKELIGRKEYDEALIRIEECYTYPPHLGEGKLPGAQENDFNYYKACILQQLGKQKEAHDLFLKASMGDSQPAAAMYYNDQKPDKIFYQGLAFRKLGQEKEARSRFNKLITYGEEHLFDIFQMDYFAVSLPDLLIWEDDMDKKNRIHCNYLMALGHLGLGNTAKAEHFFEVAASMDNNHQGIQIHRKLMNT